MNKSFFSMTFLVLIVFLNLSSLANAYELHGKRQIVHDLRSKRNAAMKEAELFEQMLKEEEMNMKTLLELESDYDKFVLQFISELEQQVHETEMHLNECIKTLESFNEKAASNETNY
jgi:hypothetical protein